MYNQMDPNVGGNMNQDFQQEGEYVQPNYVGNAPSGSNPKTNTMAILGFILSFFFGLIGAILCFIALSQIKKTGEKGKGFAIAGIIIGLLPLVLLIIIGVIFYVFVWQDVQANLAGSTACSLVDNDGNYESSEISEGEDGYVKCSNFVCSVFYNSEKYEISCDTYLEESDD